MTLTLLANILALAAVGLAVVTFLAAQRQRRDAERIEESNARRAPAPVRIDRSDPFGSTLPVARDAFAQARAARAAREAMDPAEVRNGTAPDPNSPRFVWWISPDAAATLPDAARATLPLWLREQVPIWPTRPAQLLDRRLGVVPYAAVSADDHAIVITARELNRCLVLPGRVTDLAGSVLSVPSGLLPPVDGGAPTSGPLPSGPPTSGG